ncbi:MAG: hypothetical protein CMK32_09970 [Porticoccaceae bacterium]|nr:hypothetical protein [Porticoccaceae bacterium]
MNKAKVWKFVKGALIASAGAALAYLGGQVIPALEVAGTSATIVAIASALVNLGKVILQKIDDGAAQ